MLQEQQQPQQTKKEELPIDFREILFTLTSRLWIIVVAGLIGGILALLYTNLAITPLYKSQATIYILDKSRLSTTDSVSIQDLSLGSQLTLDFEQLLKSRTVSDMVAEKLNLPAGSSVGNISVSTVEDTRTMMVSVTHTNPEQAQKICNALTEVSQEYVKAIMNLESITVVDRATLPTEPASPNVKQNTLMGVIAAMALAIAFILFRYFTDDAIKQEEDVNRYLGLSVLGNVPLDGVSGGSSYGSYGGYGQFGYGGYGYGGYGSYYGHRRHSATKTPTVAEDKKADGEANK